MSQATIALNQVLNLQQESAMLAICAMVDLGLQDQMERQLTIRAILASKLEKFVQKVVIARSVLRNKRHAREDTTIQNLVRKLYSTALSAHQETSAKVKL